MVARYAAGFIRRIETIGFRFRLPGCENRPWVTPSPTLDGIAECNFPVGVRV